MIFELNVSPTAGPAASTLFLDHGCCVVSTIQPGALSAINVCLGSGEERPDVEPNKELTKSDQIW